MIPRSLSAGIAPATLLCAIVLSLLPSQASAQAGCADADARAGTVPALAFSTSVRCLISAERGARGMRGLRDDRQLRIAATRHTTDMIALRYFEHVSPSGVTMQERVAATGYEDGTSSWSIGEVLAWGTGARSTPHGVVAGWMASPPHRAIVLDPAMRDIGVALMDQTPLPGSRAGVTVTAELGRRTRQAGVRRAG